MQRKSAVPLAYVAIAALLLCSPAFISWSGVVSASAGTGKRTGIYIAADQAYYPYPYSSASSFVSQYESAGLFSTILVYAQCSSPCSTSSGDFAWTLQLASAFDSVSNFKMVVAVGFDLGSSADWATVQSFVFQLASHPSVGWVGIEGEHSTYTGCEWDGTCPSIGQAVSAGTLSGSQLEAYYSQFDGMVASAGLSVAHYYVTFGSPSFKASEPAIFVAQWPACGPGGDVTNCGQVDQQTSELQTGNSAPYIGISGGLSTNSANYWNPTVSGTSSLDDVIRTYISVAEQQPSSSRQLFLFETGAYGYLGDQWRSVFTNDLASAMGQYSDFIYPGGTTPLSTSTSSVTTTSTSVTISSSTSSSTRTTSTSTTSASTTTTTTRSITSVHYQHWFRLWNM